MKNAIFVSVIIITFFSAVSLCLADNDRDKRWYNLMLTATSLEGSTGLFNIPSTKVVSKGMYCMGVHKYKFKYNLGLPLNFDAGFMFDAEEFEDFNKESLEKFVFNAKYNLLKEDSHYIDFSVGVEDKEFYAVASKCFPGFFNFALHPGIKRTRDDKYNGFVGVTKLNWRVLFISDYKDDSYSFGIRTLLAEKLRLDFFLIKIEDIKGLNFDSIVFGLSFSE